MNDARDEEPIESPPEGSHCSEHPERVAVAVCPRCGSYSCLSCWHDPVRRCHACIMREPSAVGPGVPWEDPDRNIVSRFVGTLVAAVQPTRTAISFATGEIGPALRFMLLSFIPLALLEGIIPYTHTLLFGPTFAVSLTRGASNEAVPWDVLQAMGLGLGINFALFLMVALPFASLAKAYGEKGHAPAPWRTALYRGWLIPFGALLKALVTWGLPRHPHAGFALLLIAAAVIPLILMLSGMRSSARMSSGVGPFASILVIGVPIVLFFIGQQALLELIRPILPNPETLSAATALLVL